MYDSNHTNGNTSLFLSIILGVFSWITPDNIDVIDLFIKILTFIGAMTAAVMATIYHYYALKEKKASLRSYEKEKNKEKDAS